MEDAVADALRIKDKEKKTKEKRRPIISWFYDPGLKTKREGDVWRE